jgi:hypothetical protein
MVIHPITVTQQATRQYMDGTVTEILDKTPEKTRMT